MNRVALAVVLLAACKSKSEPPKPTATVVRPDAAVVASPCDAVADNVAKVFERGVRDPAQLPKVRATILAGCNEDDWSDEVRTCIRTLAADASLDQCTQKMSPYAELALLGRLQQAQIVAAADDAPACKVATAKLALAWALDASRATPARATVSANRYGLFAGALSTSAVQACEGEAWPPAVRDCLAALQLPQDRARASACLATLPAPAITALEQVRAELEPQLLIAPSADCQRVGDVMAQIWVLKAQAGMAKHPEAAQWDLDHLTELRKLVIEACTDDAWPAEPIACLTGLKLPDQAPGFETCLGSLTPEASEALAHRTGELEALRDQAIGADP